MRVLSTIKFTVLRMVRNYIVLLLLLVVPILLITFFSYILSGVTTETGVPLRDENAMQMVLVFQLFGGSIVMYMIYNDLFTENKMRIYSLPFNQTMYAFSIMLCGAVYSILLGVILMVYAQLVLGVVWGNWVWTIYIISLMAILSIIVCLIFTFSVKKYKIAERLSEVYGVGFVLLAGFFFPMPENAFFDFFGTYGNPLTLSIGAVHEMDQSNLGEAWFQANILLGAIIILFMVMLILGRRRMG
ncbi:multidrug ABC transporter permease [Virgibacillus profundi]|uniref:Multidrug ABC transporter permease n=1 Tax=Virgibacillus profundi TaxID=2024555 RepID=A0A2A2IHT6_9BACI|nr:ABC transporter permease [Virgibacillus profundi]PAV30673.1 multidrug ABC transporter permease [Virgibacillus profundi]PXY54845.1 multidrug ABC transporter permease [Virgibacillus profundi]